MIISPHYFVATLLKPYKYKLLLLLTCWCSTSGLKVGHICWPAWPADPQSNPDVINIWPMCWSFLFKSNAKWHGKLYHRIFVFGRISDKTYLVPWLRLTSFLPSEQMPGHYLHWKAGFKPNIIWLKAGLTFSSLKFTNLTDTNTIMLFWWTHDLFNIQVTPR